MAVLWAGQFPRRPSIGEALGQGLGLGIAQGVSERRQRARELEDWMRERTAQLEDWERQKKMSILSAQLGLATQGYPELLNKELYEEMMGPWPTVTERRREPLTGYTRTGLGELGGGPEEYPEKEVIETRPFRFRTREELMAEGLVLERERAKIGTEEAIKQYRETVGPIQKEQVELDRERNLISAEQVSQGWARIDADLRIANMSANAKFAEAGNQRLWDERKMQFESSNKAYESFKKNYSTTFNNLSQPLKMVDKVTSMQFILSQAKMTLSQMPNLELVPEAGLLIQGITTDMAQLIGREMQTFDPKQQEEAGMGAGVTTKHQAMVYMQQLLREMNDLWPLLEQFNPGLAKQLQSQIEHDFENPYVLRRVKMQGLGGEMIEAGQWFEDPQFKLRLRNAFTTKQPGGFNQPGAIRGPAKAAPMGGFGPPGQGGYGLYEQWKGGGR